MYHQFVIRTPRRDELRDHLRNSGIPTEIYYPVPLHLQPAFAYLGYGSGSFPRAEAASREVLALPIFPTMTEAQQKAVVDCHCGIFRREKLEAPQPAENFHGSSALLRPPT